MRKIYSLVLMAAMLLIGTNVQALNVAKIGNTEYATLWSALVAAIESPNPTTIQLIADAPLTIGQSSDFSTASYGVGKKALITNNSSRLWIGGGVNITLDLNGYNVTNAPRINFANATFKITGKGTYTAEVSQGLNLYGTFDETKHAGEYTHLILDKDVTYNGPSGREQYGIGMMYAKAANDFTGNTSTDNSVGCGMLFDVYGTVFIADPVASNGQMSKVVTNPSKLHVHAGGKLEGSSAYEAIAGDNNPTSGDSDDKAIRRAIYKWNEDNGKPGTDPHNNADNGLYCPAYMDYVIEGTVMGGNGIYVKGGNLTLNNATVIATAEAYGEPIDYGNGTIGSGIAVIFDNNVSYAENMSLHVTGDTYVEATHGMAVLETTTSGENKIEASDISIESGTFVGGTEEGCIVIKDEGLIDDMKVEQSISGGTYSDNGVLNYMDNDNSIVVTAQKDGETVYVIATQPEGTTIVTDPNLNNAQATDIVKITQNGNTTLTNNVTCTYLSISSAHTVTIPNGKTLTVGEIVLDELAVIDVQAGGKLVVTGKNGIVAFAVSNIHIALQEGAGMSGTLLLSPNVLANKNPQATLDFISKATKINSVNTFQRFGIPTAANKLTGFTWKSGTGSPDTWIYEYRSDIDNWYELGKMGDNLNIADLNKPFTGYNMECHATTPGQVFTLTGSLVGNNNADLVADLTWTTFANSYTADIDLATFVSDLNSNMTKGVYVYTVNGPSYTWELYSELMHNLSGHKLPSMQAFILHNPTNYVQTSSLNYANSAFNPGTGAAAPARTTMENEKFAVITVTNQYGTTDKLALNEMEDNESGDMPKYMNDDMNFYVMADEAMATYTAEDINNSYLGFSSVNGGNFTINFANVQISDLVLVDLIEGKQVPVLEGATYTFTTNDNETNDYRFVIRKVTEVVTDVENVEVNNEKTNGIYTITGQYVGNMSAWSSLPAGIYVVDGIKKVK